MTKWLTAPEQVAWRRFLYGASRLLESLDASLQASHGLPLTDYEILVFLAEAPDGQIRMAELANHVLVSRSRLTYRVDRLTEIGYVRRTRVEDDRRGWYAEITEAGLEALAVAAPTHVEDVRRLLMDQVPPEELAPFTALWTLIGENFESGSQPANTEALPPPADTA